MREPNNAGIERRRAISAVAFSCFGWAFDLFDLFILLYIAPILAKVFFSSGQSMLSLAGVYAAFTASLLMRPVGGVLFGRYADRNGRRRAMIIAAVGVGVATALMGAIPTAAMIGIAAPVIFFVLRLAQGVFMGGMVASTHTIGTETISEKWRGLTSGIISGGGSGIGKLMASLVFLVVAQIFPGPAFGIWGWRAMFFSGLLSYCLQSSAWSCSYGCRNRRCGKPRKKQSEPTPSLRRNRLANWSVAMPAS